MIAKLEPPSECLCWPIGGCLTARNRLVVPECPDGGFRLIQFEGSAGPAWAGKCRFISKFLSGWNRDHFAAQIADCACFPVIRRDSWLPAVLFLSGCPGALRHWSRHVRSPDACQRRAPRSAPMRNCRYSAARASQWVQSRVLTAVNVCVWVMAVGRWFHNCFHSVHHTDHQYTAAKAPVGRHRGSSCLAPGSISSRLSSRGVSDQRRNPFTRPCLPAGKQVQRGVFRLGIEQGVCAGLLAGPLM